MEIRTVSGCNSVILDRGAVIHPCLARQIRQYEDGREVHGADFAEILGWTNLFFDLYTMKGANGKYPVAHLKQRLGMMKKELAGAQEPFSMVEAVRNASEIERILSTFGRKMNTGQWKAV